MGDPPELQGDEGPLFAAYHVRLRRVVGSRVRAPDEVLDDACSNAWLILLRSQPRRETVFAWLRTVAIHEAIRLAARECRDRSMDEIDWSELASPVSVEALAEFYDELARLERDVTSRQLRLVLLQAAGYRYDEIAAITGDSVRTVDRQLRRARRRLRAAA